MSGKAFQAIVKEPFLTEGYATLAPGYLHRKRCVLPSRQVLATHRFIGVALIFAIANTPLIRSKSTFLGKASTKSGMIVNEPQK